MSDVNPGGRGEGSGDRPPAAIDKAPRHRLPPDEKRAKEAREELARHERQDKALSLRLAGATYREIGQALGVSHAQAAKDVENSFSEITEENAEKVRRLELRRLDRMQRAIWQRAIGTPETDGKKAIPPDGDAIEKVLKIQARRAKLLGLDAPMAISGPDGQPLLAAVIYLPVKDGDDPSGGE